MAEIKSSQQHWPTYSPQAIEPKWQNLWEQSDLYKAAESGGKPKMYCLDFFPYPSGDGLHVGHCRNYLPTDILSRYKRMQGFNVLHPMGWDAFGEPSEQFAIAHGVHPWVTTDQNTANFRRQLTLMGNVYDWDREIDSSRPEYYRWTQWFFLLLYKRGLAYRDTNWQWWCPTCQTTLSSHEAVGGVCWRGHPGVTKREVPAWYFRITAYADELISGLDDIDWPEPIKIMQRNWIGRSEGCRVDFLTEPGGVVPVFTTRLDTLFGVTFFVLAPEHPLVAQITTTSQRAAVDAYLAQATAQSEVDRMREDRPKTGVFTGGYVTNPLSHEQVPVWVADYVLPGYGTGAIMGVPAHDARDLAFAQAHNLPIKQVISSGDSPNPLAPDSLVPDSLAPDSVAPSPGIMINSGPFDGLDSQTGLERICQALEAAGLGKKTVQYRMRDWLISRQRYWGTPIPIIHCPTCGEVPVPEDQLPVLLPEMENFQPDGSGRSPLSRVPEFVHTTCPTCGGPAERETDTMGGFACSAWYFLRFTSPHTHDQPFDQAAVSYWMPVDLYVGGAEHAVLHLLYARFWTKVMADAGLLPFREPFARLLNQGQMMGPDGLRMSKSRGNVIRPDKIARQYGSDALRVYEMFMAPFEQDVDWSTQGIRGARRFLDRLYKLYSDTFIQSAGDRGEDPALERALHRTVRQVGERIDGFGFNTMVSALMEFMNLLSERQRREQWHSAAYHRALEMLLVILAPLAPHITEELWSLTGHRDSIHAQPWPAWDASLAREELAQVAVQVDGKVRTVIEVPVDASQAEVEAAALAHPKTCQHLEGRTVVKTFYVPGRVLNIVAGERMENSE